MKLDNEYFNNAAWNASASVTVGDTASLISGLKRIALDQHEADVEKVRNCLAKYVQMPEVKADVLAALSEARPK